MDKPQIFILFCEDVRDEVGNKLSLMGLLGPKIIVPSSEGILKNITVGALCRFFGTEAVDAQFEIRFINADGEASKLPPPEPMALRLEPPGEESVWTSHIIGNFQGLPVHNGMMIEAAFKCMGEEFAATLTVEQQVN
jgi:hypothetical protein